MSLNFVSEDDDLSNFKCNQHVLVLKEFIKYVRGFDRYEAEETYIPPERKEWHPLVNSYYEFAEDFDAVNRVPHLLHEKYSNASVNGVVSSTEDCSEGTSDIVSGASPKKAQKTDQYDERKAQISYLETKPKCFCIIGKPGLGEERLGKLLADYWKCVFIHPESLIQEEIRSGSRAGLCIEFNLRCGRAISVDVITRLLAKRLNSDIVKHRGFVICGFPLIQNNLFSEDPVSSESAIFNVHEIFEDIIEGAIETVDSIRNVSRTSLNVSDEEDNTEDVPVSEPDTKQGRLVIHPSLDIGKTNEPICYQTRFYTNDANQMDYVFSLLDQHDYLIIYLKCPNEEVVNIRQDMRYDSQTLQPMSIQREHADNIFYTLYSMYSPTDEEKNQSDMFMANQKTIKVQRDFPGHVRVQLQHYLLESQLIIEKYILLKDPQEFIKLDGRMSPHRLFQVLRMRLKVLPLTPVILPKMLMQPTVDFDEPTAEGTPKPREADMNFEDYTPEEAYELLCTRKSLGPLYKWNLSEWKFSCPVAMKEGFQETGKPKFAINFMNKMFFLSNETRCEAFLRNPRPYLMPPMPLTVRKVYLIGPKNCGKSAIAKCIQRLNGATIIDFYQINQKYAKLRMADRLNAIKMQATRTGLDNMKEMRKQAYFKLEEERKRKVQVYVDCIKQSLQQLRDAIIALSSYEDVEFTPFPSPSSKDKSTGLLHAEATAMKLSDFRTVFEIVTAADCDMYLNNESLILERLPEEMQEPLVFTFAVVSTNSPYVVKFVNDAVQKAQKELASMATSPEELAECLNEVISKHNQLMSEGQITGWIVDGFPPSSEVLHLMEPKNVAEITYLISDSTDGESLLTISRGAAINIDASSLDKLLNSAGVSEMFERSETYVMSVFDTEMEDNKSVTIEDLQKYLWEYLPDIEAFNKQNGICSHRIDVGGNSLKKVLINLIEDFKLLHNQAAREVTPDEKLEEPQHYVDMIDAGEDLEDEEDDGKYENETIFRENRRLGNTADYDPVAFYVNNVLWKGREKNLATYMNKMWLFATLETMEKFIESPYKYAKHKTMNVGLPPPRLCIVGNKMIGKTTQARDLCKRLGLYYFDFKSEFMERTGRDSAETSEDNDDTDESLLKDLILPLWQDPNKKTIGFVLDGWPRRPNDINFMMENFLIPDCIIELSMDTYFLNERLLNILLDEWHVQINLEKQQEQVRHDIEMDHWRTEREHAKAKLLEERRQQRFAKRQMEEEDDTSENESLLSYYSYQDAADQKEIEELLNEDCPEPLLYDRWETIDMATERLVKAIEADTTNEPDFLIQLKILCEQNNINWISINANMEQVKVYNLIMQNIVSFKYRSNSLFERAYDITIEMAEQLLEHGYYFLSCFGKMCPVQMYENYNPLQMYINKEAAFQLFPVIYTNFIYFLAGTENRDKFKKDILKYVLHDFNPVPLLRARIAVIGPPHCGKTTICERIKNEYSLEHISIGKATRNVLKYMPNSVLSQRVRVFIDNGDEVPYDLAMQCVEAMTFEAKAVALGYVMDGLPNSIEELKLLAQMNLVPHLIIDLEATLSYIFEYMDIFAPTHKPEYSKKFIKYRYDDWAIDKGIYRQWVDKEYQNMAIVSVMPSKWKTWTNVKEIMLSVMYEIKHYYCYAQKDMVLRVSNMLVTPYEFLCSQSDFKNFCNVCLYLNNTLNCGGSPPDRTGLVSYNGKFYWLCGEHINAFVDDPDHYLGPNIRHTLPLTLPDVLNLHEMPENVFYNGYCVVCLAENKPDRVLNLGSLNIPVLSHGGFTYLFDTQECYQEFFKKPNAYANTSTNFPDVTYPATDINSLPTMGMLEQYVANQVIKALIDVESIRPLIPGLSISQSAVVCLGLLLKINNPNTPDKYVEMYKKSKRQSIDFQTELKRLINDTKKVINPYLHYQEPLPLFKMDLDMLHKESTTSMYIREVIDGMLDRIDYDEEHANAALHVLGG